MKNKFLIICSLLLFAVVANVSAQGIKFFDGTLEEAMAEAKKRDKLVFVDFYADWCGPCKALSANVFPAEVIGTYFNEKFISVKVDTDAPANKQIVKKYKVTAMPTLLFMDADGKAISVLTGSLPVESLLRAGKVATGDELSFLALYEKSKTAPDDLNLVQRILAEAPSFVSTIEKMEREKWILRIEKMFKDYVLKKMNDGNSLVNKEDYRIITTFHKSEVVGDEIVEFVNKNMEGYMACAGKGAGMYIVEYQNKVISSLAQKGDEAYKTQLERINGDMKLAYSVIAVDGITPYEVHKYLYDGEYILYHKLNADEFIVLMEKYFAAMGESVNGSTYAVAGQKMYRAMGKKMTDVHHKKAAEWFVKSLQFKMALMERVNVIVLLGDSYRDMKNYGEARKLYNQAYMEAMQAPQEGMKKYLQMAIKKKLSALELLNK